MESLPPKVAIVPEDSVSESDAFWPCRLANRARHISAAEKAAVLASHRGPTEQCNWVVPGVMLQACRLVIGAPAPIRVIGAPAPIRVIGAPAPIRVIGAPAAHYEECDFVLRKRRREKKTCEKAPPKIEVLHKM